MNSQQLADAYEQFFAKSEAGRHFMGIVQEFIENGHRNAESKPELSRDYVQRVKGVRDIADHIQSVLALAERRRSKE